MVIIVLREEYIYAFCIQLLQNIIHYGGLPEPVPPAIPITNIKNIFFTNLAKFLNNWLIMMRSFLVSKPYFFRCSSSLEIPKI